MNFDAQQYRYASRRSVVFAKGGMACSTSPLASGIGRDVMARGGNAVDAAVAMAAAMPVLEPTGNGLGADSFVLIWTGGKLYGLNGSGFAPRALSAEAVRAAGYDAVPLQGWLPVMVPGAMGALAEVRRRFGTKPLAELMEPAIRYAREGYPVPVTAAQLFANETERLNAAFEKDPRLFAPAREQFTKNGKPLQAGDIFKSEDMANTLTELAATDCESFYRGALAQKMVDWSRQTGGFLSTEDFAACRPEWVEPISTDYHGYTVFEMPPNGHGITVLMALNILAGMELPADRDSTEAWHKMIEALKLAFTDAKAFVADPRTMKTQVRQLLSPEYAARRRALIGETALAPTVGDPRCGDTVYFCTADAAGNMVSYIQSNYHQLGSLVTVPGTGIALQDRGANFSMDPASDNYLAGGKKSYHTIIPGFLAKDGKPIGPFGVMGGFMQPQGHLQVLVNTIDYGMNPQQALDAPRFQWVGGKNIELEAAAPAGMEAALAARGHAVKTLQSNISMGRGQIIWRREDGVLCAGTEPRSDGSVAAL